MQMTSKLIAGYSLIAMLTLTGGAVSGESYLQQAPSAETNPAFVEQLPETVVMPASRPPAIRRTASHRPKQVSRTRTQIQLANSVFPSVGSGVTERAAPAPTDNRLPTVGPGAVGH
ncbi:hypothetical protein BJ928_1053 [Rhizobium sp. WW_1]|nr:hypothetical protein BJ928_1053 [Rhizobium sp. WW_1]